MSYSICACSCWIRASLGTIRESAILNLSRLVLNPSGSMNDPGDVTHKLCMLMLDQREARNDQGESQTQYAPAHGGCHDSSVHPYPHLICWAPNNVRCTDPRTLQKFRRYAILSRSQMLNW